MTLKFRRFLYIFFILLFFIITPLVWLYTAGYKLTGGWQIQKTGMLIIETEPRGAKIYINDEPKQQFLKKIFSGKNSYITTPAKIKNLLPEKYDIKIEKKNYWPWEKKITIESGKTTFLEDVRLFKNDLPQMLIKDPFSETYVSPDKKFTALKNDNQIIFLNLESNELEKYSLNTPSFDNTYSQANEPWSFDSQKILINNLLFDINNIQKPININSKALSPVNNLKWDANTEKIYYLNAEGIGYLNVSSGKTKQIINNNSIFDYLPKDNLLYYLETTNQSTALNIFHLGQEEIIGKIKLPAFSYEFINPEHKLINLYNKEHKILYLIDPFSNYKPLVDIINNVNKTKWIDNNNLLFSNDFEIWLLDLKTSNRALLTRISSEIKNIIWHPAGKYIVYTTENSINILEIGDDNRCCSTKIIEAELIENINLDKEGETLYFKAKINNTEGFYKLAI